MQAIIEQYLQTAIPEYSTYRGQPVQRPVDIGTLAKNMNYQQDIGQTLQDPFMAALSGYFNPASFAPTYEEPEYEQLPERPLTTRLSTYTDDPIMGAVIKLVQAGADPRTAVIEVQKRFPEAIPEAKFDDVTKRANNEAFEYYLKEAEGIRDEVAMQRNWESQVAEIEGRNSQLQPTEVPSAAAKAFTDAGFHLPTEQYTTESLVPDYAAKEQYVQDAGREADSSAQAYRQALSARSNRNKARPEADSLEQLIGQRQSTGSRVPSHRGRTAEGGMRPVDPVAQQLNRIAAPSAGGMINSANRSLSSQLEFEAERKKAHRKAVVAQMQGRTPFLDQVYGRAGL
jgi:hypothetical protein